MKKIKFHNNILGLKPYNWLLIIALLLIMVVVCLGGVYAKARLMQAHAQGISEATPIVEPYKAPPLAPQPEREYNIALIKKIWGKSADIGLKIARAESGYRTKATNNNTNGTQDQGIFQINTVHKMPDMFNPTANVLYAYQIYLQQGTNPWLSSAKGWK